MSATADTPLPNYLAKLLAMDFAAGTVTIVTVRHDDWCTFWAGGSCDCDPVIECRPLETETR